MRKVNGNQMKLFMATIMTLYTISCFFPARIGMLYFYLSKIVTAWAAFAAVEGIRHTSCLKNYLLRLYAFAGIMFLGNLILNTGFGTEETFLDDNVFITIAFGVSALALYRKELDHEKRKLSGMIGGILLAFAGLAMQQGYLTIPIMLISAWKHDDARSRDLYLILFSIFLLASELMWGGGLKESVSNLMFKGDFFFILVIPFLHMYDGTRGNKSALIKYFFYSYYPVHIWTVAIILNMI